MGATAQGERATEGERPPLRVEWNGRRVTITLDDPSRRNALGRRLFAALEDALAEVERRAADSVPALVPILRIRGSGPAFCAGFDLEACAGDDGQTTLAEFIVRLSSLLRRIRRGAWVAVAEVHGAALAGGCALAAACDFVLASNDALFGYPVHRLGVSPAVNAPLVSACMGDGAARALLLSGELIDGAEAARRGLAWRSVAAETLAGAADDLVSRLLLKGPMALLTTKRWLNELDGSDRDDRFEGARAASLELCGGEECARMIASFVASRRGAPGA